MAPEVKVYNAIGYLLWRGPQHSLAKILSSDLCPHYTCLGQDAGGKLQWCSCTMCGVIGTLYTEAAQ